MDIQFWIWLIVIIITLIARANKKKPEQPPVSDDDKPYSPPTTEPRQPKAITFEDLLREIQGEKAVSRPVAKAPEEKKYDFVDYDDELPDEAQEFEVEKYDTSKDDEAFKTYEEAKKLAFNRPSLEETSNIGEVVRFDHFKEYDKKRKGKPSFDFLKELKDPKGFRKAFIMSEILNRKY